MRKSDRKAVLTTEAKELGEAQEEAEHVRYPTE